MKIFNLIFSPFKSGGIPADGYVANVFPTNHRGASPARYIHDDLELDRALDSLGLSEAAQAETRQAMRAGQHHAILAVPLDIEIAAEFGWTPE
jgi:hypothetical protein